jgi:hypothetical protein
MLSISFLILLLHFLRSETLQMMLLTVLYVLIFNNVLIWEQDDDFGLYLKNLITSDMIQKEELYIQEQLSSK